MGMSGHWTKSFVFFPFFFSFLIFQAGGLTANDNIVVSPQRGGEAPTKNVRPSHFFPPPFSFLSFFPPPLEGCRQGLIACRDCRGPKKLPAFPGDQGGRKKTSEKRFFFPLFFFFLFFFFPFFPLFSHGFIEQDVSADQKKNP